MNLRAIEHSVGRRIRDSERKEDLIKDNWIFGKNICVTGTFIYPRTEVMSYIKLLGGSNHLHITKSTNILIVSDSQTSNTSKQTKAKSNDIEIIEENVFVSLLSTKGLI